MNDMTKKGPLLRKADKVYQKIKKKYQNIEKYDLEKIQFYLQNKVETSKVVISISTGFFVAIVLEDNGKNIKNSFLHLLLQILRITNHRLIKTINQMYNTTYDLLLIFLVIIYFSYIFLFWKHQRDLNWLRKYKLDLKKEKTVRIRSDSEISIFITRKKHE